MLESNYKAVIFDFDDTLVESRLLKWAQHKTVAKKFYDLDLADEEIIKHWGKPFNILLGELYKNSDILENIHKALDSTRNDFFKKEYEGAVDVINTLIENGIKIGVLSSANKNHLYDDLFRLNFPIDKFIVIQGADETLVHKPNGEVFLPVSEKLLRENIFEKDIVYIGDSLDDLEMSKQAGIDFIGITTGLYLEKDFRDMGARIVVSNIKEIPGHIFK